MLCVGLSVCIGISALTGCAKSAPDSVTQEQLESSGEETLKINEGFPLVDEPVTLHMVVQSFPSQDVYKRQDDDRGLQKRHVIECILPFDGEPVKNHR